MMYTQTCHCGHDKDTHFEKSDKCLGMLCECPEYTHEHEPLPRKTAGVSRPVPFDDEIDLATLVPSRDPATLPSLPAALPVVHGPWCQCPQCVVTP